VEKREITKMPYTDKQIENLVVSFSKEVKDTFNDGLREGINAVSLMDGADKETVRRIVRMLDSARCRIYLREEKKLKGKKA
jgi:hypothetical protein